MRIIGNPERLRALLDREHRAGKKVGFVPTMGALHEGHMSLVRAACRENQRVVVSIFVNPAQFGPSEDFSAYPRTLAADKEKLSAAGAAYLFLPKTKTLYPRGYATLVRVGEPPPVSDGLQGENLLTRRLCGRFRPGHFDGVATVVAKLINIVRPDRIYFGAKDYQQTVVVRRLVKDLNMGCEVKLLPTARERDGLAMSSRNRYLSAADRGRARVIPETLFWARDRVRAGQKDLAAIKREAVRRLRKGVDTVQYFEWVHPETLAPLNRASGGKIVAATACLIGKTRLIDNVIIRS